MLFSRITNQTHNTRITPYIFSRLFERAAYFGLMSFLFIYIFHTKKDVIPIEDARSIYRLFINTMFLAMLIGGIIGDLIIGNKKGLLLGGILMSLGIFALSTPSLEYYKYGFILIGVGNGLYAPNLLASFAKQYTKKEKLFDSGFILLILAINIGGFLGPLLFMFSRNNEQDYSQNFIIVGSMMLLSVIISSFIKEVNPIKNKQVDVKSNNLHYVYLIIIILGTGIFWYYIDNYFQFMSILEFNNKTNENISLIVLLTSIQSLLSIGLAVLVALILSFLYINRYLKLVVGFSLIVLPFSILFNLPETIEKEKHLPILSLSIFLFVFSELLITPTLYALIRKFGNFKYYAILFALVYLPYNLLKYFINSDNKYVTKIVLYKIKQETYFLEYIFIFLLISFLLIFYINKRRKKILIE